MILFSHLTKHLKLNILLHASGNAAAITVSEIIKSELPHVEIVNTHSTDRVLAQLQEAVVLFIIISDYNSLDNQLDSITKDAKRLNLLIITLCIEPVFHKDRELEKYVFIIYFVQSH